MQENVRVRDHLENLGAEERIILKRIFKKYERSVEWIDLVHYYYYYYYY
jgi:hypothetical protein